MTSIFGATTRIAVVQSQIDEGASEANYAAAIAGMREAAASGAELICLPAAFATGLNLPRIRETAQPLDGPIVQALAREARALRAIIVAGVLERDGGDIYDSVVVVGSGGEMLGRYRRISLWEGERDFISRGSGQSVVATPLGKVGLLVSYDLRFPEACRTYFVQGVDLIVCVANLFTEFGHCVEALCRARAADNTCALAFASAVGSSRLSGMELMGRSLIVDGTLMACDCNRERDILARAERRPQLLAAELPTRSIRRAVKKLPYLQDLRASWPLQRNLEAS